MFDFMARPKKFSREGVLDKAIPVFWRYGLTGSNVQQLESATGVNKSGLYSEFQSKDELFTAALQRYLDTGPALGMLEHEPLGWSNVEHFLLNAPIRFGELSGCFSVNSTREAANLPAEALKVISAFNISRLASIQKNVAAEKTKMDADDIADLIWTFFSGTCVNANLDDDKEAHSQRVTNFMRALKQM
jgi:TetR/AcrR family transcriptional regulator, copper-responsive repressor